MKSSKWVGSYGDIDVADSVVFSILFFIFIDSSRMSKILDLVIEKRPTNPSR
jgi:hypothetical protein